MPKPRKRKQASPFEKMFGIHGTTSAQASDMFTNAAARQGYGTPSLGQGASYELVRLSYDYWQLITLYRNHWISRRIVEVPAQDMVKAWPKLTSDIEPKDNVRIDRALRKTNTKNNILTGLTWGRLFGGAGALIVIDGQEDELDQPLDLDSIKIGAYKGIIPFDRWAGISPVGDVCTDINRPLDFNKPERYDVRVAGGASFQVHSSRLMRFLGPTVPTPELEAQSYWGISVLEPTYESITMLDNTMWNILGLTFRANLLGLKFPELAQLLSGMGSSQLASQKFEQRMSAINHLMSNQSLIPLPTDGGLESTQFTFGGLEGIFQLFQLNLAGAAQMPVTRLFGRTYTGLGQTGDGDERIYEEKISTDQSTYLEPQLEKLYPVICMSELGEVPDDLDLDFPSIRVLDEKEKAELAKSVADTTTVYLNGGIMSPRVVAREVKQSSTVTGIGTNLTDEDIDKLSDKVQAEGEMGEGLFGGEGAGLGEADSPAKAIKEENKEDKGGPDQQDEPKKAVLAKAGEAKDTAPAYDVLPQGLSEGEKVLVNGKLLTVHRVVTGTIDLFGDPTVQVLFKTGEVVAYRPTQEVARATDAAGDKAGVLELDAAASLDRQGAQYRIVGSNGFATKLMSSAALAWKVAYLELRNKYWHANDSGKAKDADGASSVTQLSQAIYDYHALPVRIETKQGAVRTGVTPDGKSWRTIMPADYGFIEGVEGADGDSLDCYVGLSPESNNVYVVDQLTLDGSSFDEHKVMLGYYTEESAKEDYMLGHHLSSKTFGRITGFTMPMFRRWTRLHDMRLPASDHVPSRARDAAEFKEADHPRKDNGQFGKGAGGGAPSAEPKGSFDTPIAYLNALFATKAFSNEEMLEKVNKKFGTKHNLSYVALAKNKTPEGKAAMAAKAKSVALAEKLLGEGKFADGDIAKAVNVANGTNFTTSDVKTIKSKLAKKAGVKANNVQIAQAAKVVQTPEVVAKVNAALTAEEKKNYKTMYVSAKDASGKAVYFKVSDVPDGLNDANSMKDALSSLGTGLTYVNAGEFSSSKPAPLGGYKDAALSTDVATKLKDAKYAAAALEQEMAAQSKAEAAKANKKVTELTEELSPAMQQAIKHYTNGSYSDLNGQLRKGQPLSAEQAFLAAELDKAIKSAKLKEDTTLYRKMSHPEAFLGPSPKVGAVLIDNGFLSTSKQKDVWSGSVRLTIKCKAGAAALDVQSLSLHNSESEVMLPRGSMFKILGINSSAGKHNVEVEYMG